jgi:hypothetical protein
MSNQTLMGLWLALKRDISNKRRISPTTIQPPIVVGEIVDNKGTTVNVTFLNPPDYRTIDGLTEVRSYMEFSEPFGYSDKYVTWMPVFTEWWFND